jgi:uncharacterized protein CbrC (UPF0167 family)
MMAEEDAAARRRAMADPQFRLMPATRAHARFTDAACRCGAAGPNLDGAFFEGDDVRPVCLRCLAEGKIPRDLVAPRDALRAHLKERQRAWSAAKLDRIADEKTAELAKTPPVPWLRENAWPVCCEDFAVYRGEWAQRDWAQAARDGNGQAALGRVLGDAGRAAELWKDLPAEVGEAARHAAFVFFCPTCKKLAVVAQAR